MSDFPYLSYPQLHLNPRHYSLFLIAALLALAIVLLLPRKARGTVAFFHPRADAKGGGEKVLWFAIRSIREYFPNHRIVVYTVSTASGADILREAEEAFGARVGSIRFVRLKQRWLLGHAPFLSLLFQALGDILIGVEAVFRLRPEICIDTAGHAFAYPVFRFVGGSRVISYSHYPFICRKHVQALASSDRGALYKLAKKNYYSVLVLLYGLVGRCASAVAVNSSWTKSHIDDLFGVTSTIVYPPCDVPDRLREGKRSGIVSVGQFRPEKNHALQIETMERLGTREKLTIIGSCRNQGDEERAEHVRSRSAGLNVQIMMGVDYGTLIETLDRSLIGVHTMKEEHFGISVVEMMAHGCITVAHNSAGPKLDIIEHGQNGFLADGAEDYVACIGRILKMGDREREVIRTDALESCRRFSNESFVRAFKEVLQHVFPHFSVSRLG